MLELHLQQFLTLRFLVELLVQQVRRVLMVKAFQLAELLVKFLKRLTALTTTRNGLMQVVAAACLERRQPQSR